MIAIERLTARLEMWFGITLDRGGRFQSLERYANERARELGLASLDKYVDGLAGPSHPEVERLVAVVTVNYTWFFRDAEQLQALAQLLRDGWPPGQEVRIWIAACSTGEEAYTVAMLTRAAGRPAKIKATDINAEALRQALEARYGKWSVRDVPPAMRAYLAPASRGTFQVSEALRLAVSFERHNLLDPPPAPPWGGGWDLVLCRNVLIYFRPDTVAETLSRLGKSLAPGGWLLLGTEVVTEGPAELQPASLGERLALRRPPEGEAHAALPRVLQGVVKPLAKAPARPAAPTTLAAEQASAAAAEAARTSAIQQVTTGNRQVDAGNVAEALEDYGEALRIDPLCAEAHMFMGIALYQAGDSLGAMRALRAALFLAPTLWPGAFYLALAYDDQGRAAEAQQMYRQVVESCEVPIKLASQGSLVHDLEAWKRDVVTLSKKRARREASL